MVSEPTGVSQASNTWYWKKARVNLAFRINQGFYQIHIFLAEVLTIRSIFSSCLAVLQISRMSEFFQSKALKNLNFHLSLVKCFSIQCKKNLNRFQVAVHLFNNTSHVMSEYGKSQKKWHMRCSLACSSCQLLKQSKTANSTTIA